MQKVISPMCVAKGELSWETPWQALGCARVILEESVPPLQISLIKPKNPAMEDVAKSSNYVWFFISRFYWETYKTFIPSSAKYECWEVQNLPSKPGFCHYSCPLPPCLWLYQRCPGGARRTQGRLPLWREKPILLQLRPGLKIPAIDPGMLWLLYAQMYL